MPRAKVLYNFGRADQVDRGALQRLIDSVSRFLRPEGIDAAGGDDDAGGSAAAGLAPVVDARPMGTSWVADQLWQRLGIDTAIRRLARDRRVDAALVERVILAMVANRLSVQPLSKRAGCKRIAERVFIDGLAGVSDDACYRAMGLLFDVLGEVQRTMFFGVANLLNLHVDRLLFDTTSTLLDTLSRAIVGWTVDAAESETVADRLIDARQQPLDTFRLSLPPSLALWHHTLDAQP